MRLREALRRALRGQTFGRDETHELLVGLAHDDFEPLEFGAWLAALATRGETAARRTTMFRANSSPRAD